MACFDVYLKDYRDEIGKKNSKKNNALQKNIDSRQIKKTPSIFPVVGIGASAGGLEAIQQFFTHVPPKSGIAYIVVTHLDPDHMSMMFDLINKYTDMPVLTISNNMKVVPDSIYVIPPRKNVYIKNNCLYLVEQSEPHYANLPIDFFLRSLALDKQENAVAIILSGTGSDGSMGVRDIKLNGGMVIVQASQSAKFDQMPRNAVNTGVVDFVLPPKEIFHKLTKWLSQDVSEVSLELQRIFSIVRAKTGYDFSLYKLNTIHRRIDRQMITHHLSKLSEYVKLLRENPEEVNSLFNCFLIGVTRFFRDPESFEVLKKEILPEIFNNKSLDDCVRIWIPGCSTGEEVYSIAIIICEYMEETNNHRYVQIFGTDIYHKALTAARSGIFSEIIKNDVSPERLRRFFTKEKNRYRIDKEIRSMVVFGEQSLIKDPPFTKVDIISCRNLLIYLNISLQKKIFPLFHYSLRPRGVLFLGTSESIAGYNDLFSLINKKHKFFKRKETISLKRSIVNFPHLSHHPATALNRNDGDNIKHSKLETDFMLKKYLINKFVPPSILVNKQGEILYFHENMKKYIQLPEAGESLNIYDVMPTNIKKILKSAILTATLKKKELTYHDVTIKYKKRIYNIDLKIIFLNELPNMENILLVVFEAGSPRATLNDVKSLKKITDSKKEKMILQLKDNLRHTTENLQATVEELESSNEELQSMNEELQSTNEEIETSKEELNSLNEELVVMNTELQNRIDKLATVHDDMANLYNSTEIATFFLDNNLCIKGFTPNAQELIRVIPSDIGRSIAHFSTTLIYEKLVEDAEEVIRTLHQKSIEVKSKTGQWFLIRILPYRTLSNKIDGVVVTLNDISSHKEAENKLNQLNEVLNNVLSCWKNILDTVMIPSLVLDTELKVITANRAYYKIFNLLPEDVTGKVIYNIKGFDQPAIKELLNKLLPKNNIPEEFEAEVDYPLNGHSKIFINARKIYNAEFGDDMILFALELR